MNQSITLTATDPFQTSTDTRYKLQGYQLDGAPIVYATTVNIVMDKSHIFKWIWREEFMLTLTSNFGHPPLNGTGWRSANSTIPISAPQTFLEGDSQYYFENWVMVSGTANITAPHNVTASVIMQTPATIQAQYRFVTSSGEATAQLLIKNGATPLYSANVTVTDDANVQIWRGLTDTSGLTGAFTVKNTLLYTVKVQYQSLSYSVKQKFPNSQTYTVDVSQGQPTITWAQIAPFVFPIIIVVVLVVAIVIYLQRRNSPERPQYEWVKA